MEVGVLAIVERALGSGSHLGLLLLLLSVILGIAASLDLNCLIYKRGRLSQVVNIQSPVCSERLWFGWDCWIRLSAGCAAPVLLEGCLQIGGRAARQ